MSTLVIDKATYGCTSLHGAAEDTHRDPQAPKAESLRQAMLKVMAMPQYGHPAYWAPYAPVGDGGR
jgi:hypothetical protein